MLMFSKLADDRIYSSVAICKCLVFFWLGSTFLKLESYRSKIMFRKSLDSLPALSGHGVDFTAHALRARKVDNQWTALSAHL